MTAHATARELRPDTQSILSLIGRAFIRDKWIAPIWVTILTAAVYASAVATPWMYPTLAQRVGTAEAINASPGIVALYGPILDTHSLGELAMAKMTVLYAALVAIMCLVIVRRHIQLQEQSVERRAAALLAAMGEAAMLATLVGALAALAATVAGLPGAGSLAFGASWAGIGLVATALTASVYQLPFGSIACGRIAAAAIGVLFALRAVGDSVGLRWLSWLSPFGWSTRLEAWSNPRWTVLTLYAVTALILSAVAVTLSDHRTAGTERPSTPSWHRTRNSLVIWTLAVGFMGAYFGAISGDISALLGSTHARELIQRLGGTGPPGATLIGAELSIVAATVTAFGITVLVRAAAEPPHRHAFSAAVAVALSGSTWLLLMTGLMFSVGQFATGQSATASYVAAALNHAPAVWTLVAMTAVAWSLRPQWAVAGWGLLALFTVLGPAGRLMDFPRWMVDLSPYARIALMPAERFDAASTIALIAGGAVLLAIAAFNNSPQQVQ